MVHFETVLNFSASPYRKSRYGAIWWASPLLTPIISSATSSQWSPHSADPLAEGLLAATITSGGDESIRRPERTGARRSDHTVLPQVRKGVCRHAEHRSPRRGQAYRHAAHACCAPRRRRGGGRAALVPGRRPAAWRQLTRRVAPCR